MSFFVLDTDTVSLYQREHPRVVTQVEIYPALQLAVTVITVEEQLMGRHALTRQAKTVTETARGYGLLAQSARFFGAKLNVGSSDLRIAAIVLEQGATLVTRNTRDFERVPGLTFTDWSQ